MSRLSARIGSCGNRGTLPCTSTTNSGIGGGGSWARAGMADTDNTKTSDTPARVMWAELFHDRSQPLPDAPLQIVDDDEPRHVAVAARSFVCQPAALPIDREPACEVDAHVIGAAREKEMLTVEPVAVRARHRP